MTLKSDLTRDLSIPYLRCFCETDKVMSTEMCVIIQQLLAKLAALIGGGRTCQWTQHFYFYSVFNLILGYVARGASCEGRACTGPWQTSTTSTTGCGEL